MTVYCPGCEEDYDPTEESHIGHEICGIQTFRHEPCFLEPGHQNRPGQAYHKAIHSESRNPNATVEWR